MSPSNRSKYIYNKVFQQSPDNRANVAKIEIKKCENLWSENKSEAAQTLRQERAVRKRKEMSPSLTKVC